MKTAWTTTAFSTALALGGPAMAQVTADDVWAVQGAILSATGISQTGALSRDGDTVTVTGMGGDYALPFGAGRIGWRLGDIVMQEVEGAVEVDIGPVLRLSLMAEIPKIALRPLTLDFDLTAEGLLRRFEGTPDLMATLTRAERITIETAGVDFGDTPGADSVGLAGFVLIEGVDYTTETAGFGTGDSLTISQFGVTARAVSDVIFTAEGVEARQVGEYLDSQAESLLILPSTPLDLLNLGAALRNGLVVSTTGQGGLSRSQSITRIDGMVQSDESQSIESTTFDFFLDGEAGLATRILSRGITVRQSNPLLQQLPDLEAAEITMDGLSMEMQIPLLAGGEVATAGFDMAFDGLRLDPALYTSLGLPPGELDRPADFQIRNRLSYEPFVDLLDITGLIARVESGEPVLDLHGYTLETLNFSYAESALTGSGALGWPGGVSVDDRMPPPAGEFSFTLLGSYSLLERLGRANVLPPEAAMAIRGALAAFGRPTGDDRLDSTVTFGPEGVLLNGAPPPF